MELKKEEKINRAKFLNTVITQKTIGVYNKISHSGSLNDSERTIKSALEKVFILHTSQRSDLGKLEFHKKRSRRSNFLQFSGSSLLFIVAIIELALAFAIFISSRQTQEVDSLDSLTQITGFNTNGSYLLYDDLNVNLIYPDNTTTNSKEYLAELNKQNFNEVLVKIEPKKEIADDCIIQVPENVSRAIIYTVQKIISDRCTGLDKIELSEKSNTIDIILNSK